MADKKLPTLVLKVDLDCDPCYKEIRRALCKFREIESQSFDEKQKKVTISGPFEPEKLMKKLYCKVGCKIIISWEILKPPPVKPPSPTPPPPPPPVPKPAEPGPVNILIGPIGPVCYCGPCGSRGHCQCGGQCGSRGHCQCGSRGHCQCGGQCGGQCGSRGHCRCGGQCGGSCEDNYCKTM